MRNNKYLNIGEITLVVIILQVQYAIEIYNIALYKHYKVYKINTIINEYLFKIYDITTISNDISLTLLQLLNNSFPLLLLVISFSL